MSTAEKTMINIKTDKAVKKEAQRLVGEMGITLSAFVNGALRELIRTREVRFIAEPKIRQEREKDLLQASADYRAGINTAGPFDNVKDLMKSLNS